MASRPVWQPNYRDLSDDRTISFGAECYVCHAHYVSPPEPMVAPLPVDGTPEPALARAVEQQKQALFEEFDGAFRNITIICFRCGNPACPDCWDVDKQMCGACIAERGLIRSPHRGEPVDGPLANGLLRRAEAGQFSEIARPTWLKELLRTQSDPEAAQRATLTTPPAASGQHPRPAELPDLGSVSYPRVPSIESDRAVFEPQPTTKMDTPFQRPVMGLTTPNSLAATEGDATSGMVNCPRCGTANYDFVTQCSGCGLQLIQVCPNCDRLNPGQVEQCQQCGAPLNRPLGWSGVHQPLRREAPGDAGRRVTPPQTPITPAWTPSRQPAPRWSDAAPNAGQWGGSGGDDRAPGRGGLARRRPSPPPDARYGEQMMPAMLEVATVRPDIGGELLTAPHPYETMGPSLQPVMAYELAARHAPRGAALTQALIAIVERLFAIALLGCLFGLIGLITAAESSASANAALTALLHYDIKAHLDALLGLLHIHLRK